MLIIIYLIFNIYFSQANSSDCDVVLDMWREFGKSLPPANGMDGCCSMEGIACDGASVVKM